MKSNEFKNTFPLSLILPLPLSLSESSLTGVDEDEEFFCRLLNFGDGIRLIGEDME